MNAGPLGGYLVRLAVVVAVSSLAAAAAAQEAWESEIVYEGADGRLVYVSDEEGNRIPDFSRAGYQGGGVPLPQVSTVRTVQPVAGDDTEQVQAAIDEVSARAPDASGHRGAVELAPGTYEIAGTLHVRESGVVLRGSGDGDDPMTDTILRRSGTSQAPVIFVGREESVYGDALIQRDNSRAPATITDDVVPIGAWSFNVDYPERYSAGDPIVIFHPTTVAWLNAVDGGGTGGDPRWAVAESPIAFAREVISVEGSTVTVDAPTFTRLEKALSPSYIYLRNRSNVIEEVGVESLRIDIETSSPTSETHAENALVFGLVENAWATNVTALHFWHAGISVQQSRYVTVRDSRALDPHSLVEGSRRYNFEVYRSQLVLFEGNHATRARHAYVGNGETRDSGIVFLDNTSEDAYTSSEAHRRWGMGFLFDNHTEVGSTGSSQWDRRIHLGNRGDYGTAHGWACAHCVAWNADMNGSSVVVEKPPTAQNYAIGTHGYAVDRGPFYANTGSHIEGTNRTGLNPRSLYLRQLEDRLAPVAGERDPATGVRIFPAAPNPTAGTARIDFKLSEPGHVRLAVFDVLGREVLVLSDESYGPGRHSAHMDGRHLPSGVYLYRLTATTGSRTHVAAGRLTLSR